MTDLELVEQILKQIEVLKQFMSNDIERLTELMQELDNPISEIRANAIIREMDSIVENLTEIYSTFAVLSVPNAYNEGRKFANEILEIKTKMSLKPNDTKSLNALIKDMQHDFKTTLANGEKRAIFVLKQFSKQGRLTESEISQFVAQGYIDTNTAMGAKKIMRSEIAENNQGILDESELGRSIKRRLAKKKKEINSITVNQELRTKLLQEEIDKLQDGKFMQIIDKNGNIRTYQIDTYADLVSRTRLGDAQVAGTIEEASKYNIDTFRVSAHNTTTPFCQKFENKIFTTDTANRKFPLLTESTRPLYHVNCQHRLLPKKFTSSQLEGMANIR